MRSKKRVPQKGQQKYSASFPLTNHVHPPTDPWCKSSYESQAYIRALQLYLQDKGRYESWERLLGTEEQVSKHTLSTLYVSVVLCPLAQPIVCWHVQVLASQVMEEVLPWLQSQLQSRLRGKKAERIRQWLAVS